MSSDKTIVIEREKREKKRIVVLIERTIR